VYDGKAKTLSEPNQTFC